MVRGDGIERENAQTGLLKQPIGRVIHKALTGVLADNLGNGNQRYC